MKRRVSKAFIDKHTKKQYPKGSSYETEDKERINELVKKGHLSGKAVKTTKQAQDKVVNDNIEDMNFDDLKAVADKKGLSVEGTGKNGAIKKEDYVKALKV